MIDLLAYSVSLGGFLTVALWWVLFGGSRSLLVRLLNCMVFITLGVVSLKYIDVVPSAWVDYIRYPTIVMCLIGGYAMLIRESGRSG